MAKTIRIGGIPVRDLTSQCLIRFLNVRPKGGDPLAIGFVNHNFVVACRELKGSVGDPHGILLLNDGIGMQIAARLKHGRCFLENMNGTDFVPRYLLEADGDLSVFLLGGTADVVAKAGAMIAGKPRRRVVGCIDGFSFWTKEEEVLGAINMAKPDVLLVGLGNPKQERWILERGRFLDVGLIFGVGALFEWMAGSRRRAPLWIRRARLEWLYRLILEPRRLAKRYTIDAARFFWLVWTQ